MMATTKPHAVVVTSLVPICGNTSKRRTLKTESRASVPAARLASRANYVASSRVRPFRWQTRSQRSRQNPSRVCAVAGEDEAHSDASCPFGFASTNTPSFGQRSMKALGTAAGFAVTLALIGAPAVALDLWLPNTVPFFARYSGMFVAGEVGTHIRNVAFGAVKMSKYRKLKLPPVVKEGNAPLIGHTWLFASKEHIQPALQKYGSVHSWSHPLLSPYPVVSVFKGEEMRDLLRSEGEMVVSSWPQSIVRLMGFDSVFGLKGDAHKRMRKVIHSVLNETRTKKLATPLIKTTGAEMLARWMQQDEIRMLDEGRDWAFNVTVAYVLGVKLSEHERASLRMDFDALTAGLPTPDIGLAMGPYHKSLMARNRMAAVFKGVVKDFMRARAAGEAPPGVLREMVEAAEEEGVDLTPDAIADNLIILLFGGVETTGASFCHLCTLFTKYPEVMLRVREEQLALRAAHPEAEAYISAPYTNAVVTEVTRIANVVPAVFRKTLKPLEIDGYTIPAGWTIMPHIGDASSKAVPEGSAPVEETSPERWLGQKIPDTFMPFGTGSRMCPGKTLALLEIEHMATMLACDCNWEVLHGDEDIAKGSAVSPFPTGYRMRFSQWDEGAGDETADVELMTTLY